MLIATMLPGEFLDCMCVYGVCTYVCVWGLLIMCAYVYKCVCIYVHICTCVCIHVCVFVSHHCV